MNTKASDPLWYKDAVFYEVYLRAFCDSNADGHGDLRGLMQKLDYLQELGVDCLWLLPIYPSPLRDDGYDISDYYGIQSRFGNMQDLQDLIEAVHARGMHLVMDLVLNHTSDQHDWFQQARSDRNSPYREFYVWSDSDQVYQEARIIFLDTEKSNWTWDEKAGQYFWHRFYATQPDLNYDSERVQEEMLRVMDFWLEKGIDGFRADAVPYLFEREGTNCENLPETHRYLKRVRAHLEQKYPGRLLLAEANQWPEDVRAYFGDSDEFNMGFHFPVMPRIYMALRSGDRSPVVDILKRTPPIPQDCQWCTFLRNHDELTLEMVTEEERQWMWREYAPEARMRLNLGIRRRLSPLLDNDRRKIELANSLLFTLPGSPILYYGDEIGMGDDIWLDDRNGVRTPMQWTDGQNAGFSDAKPEALYLPAISSEEFGWQRVNVQAQQKDPGSLFHAIQRMIAIRKQHTVFGRGEIHWLEEMPLSVLAYLRVMPEERVLVINSLSGEEQVIAVSGTEVDGKMAKDLLNGKEVHLRDTIRLAPYEFRWLQLI